MTKVSWPGYSTIVCRRPEQDGPDGPYHWTAYSRDLGDPTMAERFAGTEQTVDLAQAIAEEFAIPGLIERCS